MKTKKTLAWLVQFLALCLILSFNAFAEELKSADTVHAPITQQLVTMVEHNPEIKKMLVHSIEAAKKINPDKKQIQSIR